MRPLDSLPNIPDTPEYDFPQRYDWEVLDERGLVICAQGHYLGFGTEAHLEYIWWRYFQREGNGI